MRVNLIIILLALCLSPLFPHYLSCPSVYHQITEDSLVRQAVLPFLNSDVRGMAELVPFSLWSYSGGRRGIFRLVHNSSLIILCHIFRFHPYCFLVLRTEGALYIGFFTGGHIY